MPDESDSPTGPPPDHQFPARNESSPPVGPPQIPSTPPAPKPVQLHALGTFPVVAVILLHYVTLGIFSIFWINLTHGKLPRVRSDDPSGGRALGFSFIPFFNLYWIFFSYLRLCTRIDEQRNVYGLAPRGLEGLATTNCIFQVIPGINILLGYTLFTPVFIGNLQSSVNQLAEASATTQPRNALPSLPATPGLPGWAIALIACGSMIFLLPVMAGMLLPALAKAKYRAQRINCVNNLKIIGLANRTWAMENADQFAFNVSTNKGGTLEWCTEGIDGFDQNAWRHFQRLSKELSTPRILICPADGTKQQVSSFDDLQANNVSYLLHTGTNVTTENPQLVLAICPIHHTVLMADGSVQQMSESRMRSVLQSAMGNR